MRHIKSHGIICWKLRWNFHIIIDERGYHFSAGKLKDKLTL